jgi:two-component sensor histidine kinase
MTSNELYCDQRAPRIKLLPRMSHTRDALTESEAHEQLLGMFASDLLPTVPRQAIEIARRLFKANAAGLHMCHSDGRTAVQQRDLICGDLSMLEATDTGIGKGLCKMCLDAGTTIVLSQQEVELTFLRNIRPRIVHVLVVPLYDSVRRPLGALWLAQVTSTATYSRADTLILGRLAHVLVLGLKLLADAHERAELAATVEVERKTHAETLLLLSAERTERERAEVSAIEARRTIAFKDAAIGEAHHRVKNTLQIVSGLLSLQARSSNELKTRNALREARRRLQLLAHAHECLSRSAADRQDISVFHLLSVIADTLPRAFAETSSRIRLQLTADQISMAAEDATALALIANELVTNAYKHAFADNAEGTITMHLTCDDKSSAILRIADDGIGGAREHDAKSFGLSLVPKLAEQLGGTLLSSESESGTGTVVTLTVPRSTPMSMSRTTDLHTCGYAKTAPQAQPHNQMLMV